jgi:Leucine-rich repeat (LRR) protein
VASGLHATKYVPHQQTQCDENPLLAVNVDSPFTFDFSCNAISSIPPTSALFRLFDVTGNSVGNLPDSLFEARSLRDVGDWAFDSQCSNSMLKMLFCNFPSPLRRIASHRSGFQRCSAQQSFLSGFE